MTRDLASHDIGQVLVQSRYLTGDRCRMRIFFRVFVELGRLYLKQFR